MKTFCVVLLLGGVVSLAISQSEDMGGESGSRSGNGSLLYLKKQLREQMQKLTGFDISGRKEGTRKRNATVPKFLKDLYECWTILTKNTSSRNESVLQHCKKALEDEGFDDNATLPTLITEADTVLSFLNEDQLRPMQPLNGSNRRPLSKYIALQFNASIRWDWTIIVAELRIHKAATLTTPVHRVSRICAQDYKQNGLLLNLWMGKVPDGTPVDEGSSEQLVTLLSQVRLSPSKQMDEQWVLFKDMSVDNFNVNMSNVYSFYVTLGGLCKHFDLRDFGFHDTNSSEEVQPYFTLVAKDINGHSVDHHMSTIVYNWYSRQNTTHPPKEDTDSSSEASVKRNRRSRNPCRVHEYVVDLQQIGWQHTVMLPSVTFRSKYCKGFCHAPFITDATPHAVIQALAASFDSSIPLPCCAPSSLSPLIIVMNNDNMYQLKKINDLVVDGCGCI